MKKEGRIRSVRKAGYQPRKGEQNQKTEKRYQFKQCCQTPDMIQPLLINDKMKTGELPIPVSITVVIHCGQNVDWEKNVKSRNKPGKA